MSLPIGPCPICDIHDPGWDKKGDLKRHILLEHPRTHMCMFCLDAKGWSDVFPSQGAYNDHYKEFHSGIIEKHAQKRKEVKESAKRRKVIQCFECSIIFLEVHERERHLFAAHGFDHCKLCFLMGASPQVRFHILDKHPGKLCYLCLGNSPLFQRPSNLISHLQKCHEITSKDGPPSFKCVECPTAATIGGSIDLKSHMMSKHGIYPPLQLHSMRKRAPNRKQVLDDFSQKEITGLKNESGSDCFAISVLQLLARTDLFERLSALSLLGGGTKHVADKCNAAPCCLFNFLATYAKKRVFSPDEVIQNYYSFGLVSLPVDVGDILRLILGSFNAEKEREVSHSYPLSDRQTLAEESANKAFQLSLESKFECKSCFRYTVRKTKEYVIQLNGSSTPQGTFQDSLKSYLFTQICICGAEADVSPRLSNLGLKYLFVEIDRSVRTPSRNAKDLNLYSLSLEREFDDGRGLFGGDVFEVFGTLSYLINEDVGGGHYVTRLFSPKRWTESSMLSVHETTIKETRIKPDFDTDVVIVALKRVKSDGSVQDGSS